MRTWDAECVEDETRREVDNVAERVEVIMLGCEFEKGLKVDIHVNKIFGVYSMFLNCRAV